MQFIKIYTISIGISIGLILIFGIFVNILNYFNLLNFNTYKIILIGSSSFSFLAGGFFLGQKITKRGYFKGIILGFIIVLLFCLVSYIILNQKLTLSSFVYYIVIIITSSIGAMLGINNKSNIIKNTK